MMKFLDLDALSAAHRGLGLCQNSIGCEPSSACRGQCDKRQSRCDNSLPDCGEPFGAAAGPSPRRRDSR